MLTDRMDSEVMDAAGASLQGISTVSVGFDHIDMKASLAREIKIGHTPGVLDQSTAELAVALIFAARRKIVFNAEAAKEGRWGSWSPFGKDCGLDVSGSTLGLVGFGRIGQTVAGMLGSFVCKIIYHGPNRKVEAEDALSAKFPNLDITYSPALEDLLAASDIVSVHCPLNAKTHHLFSDSTFAKMQQHACFVNTSRGGVVDQDALVRSLSPGGTLANGCAALDVTDPEPLHKNHPLFQLENCLIVPHIGSATTKTRNKMVDIAIDNLVAILTKDGTCAISCHVIMSLSLNVERY